MITASKIRKLIKLTKPYHYLKWGDLSVQLLFGLPNYLFNKIHSKESKNGGESPNKI